MKDRKETNSHDVDLALVHKGKMPARLLYALIFACGFGCIVVACMIHYAVTGDYSVVQALLNALAKVVFAF